MIDTIMIITILSFYGTGITSQQVNYKTCIKTKKLIEITKFKDRAYGGNKFVDCIYIRNKDK